MILLDHDYLSNRICVLNFLGIIIYRTTSKNCTCARNLHNPSMTYKVTDKMLSGMLLPNVKWCIAYLANSFFFVILVSYQKGNNTFVKYYSLTQQSPTTCRFALQHSYIIAVSRSAEWIGSLRFRYSIIFFVTNHSLHQLCLVNF